MMDLEGAGIFAGLLIIIVGSVIGIFAFRQENAFDANKPVVYTERATTNDDGLVIEVKGSIYESGEEMTLYGACYNHVGAPLPAANMTLSAWYPDGTQWLNATSFVSTGDGRFRIQLNMTSAKGTYLTEAICQYGGKEARTIGEWQNPVWVGKIKDTQDYLVLVNQSMYIVSSQIANLTEITLNASADILSAISSVQSDTTNILTYLGTLNTSISISGADNMRIINEVYNLVHALAPDYWVVDDRADYFGSNSTIQFNGVAVAYPDVVHAVSEEGLWATLVGSSWVATNMSGYSWNAVDAVAAESEYAWAVGSNSTAPVYSVNKVFIDTINGSAAAEFTDVVLHYANGSVHAYVAGDNGELWHFDGLNFALEANLSGYGPMKVDVLDDDSVFVARGDYLHWRNGPSYSSLQFVGQDFVDVGVAYPDLAYAISFDNATQEMKFYIYRGSNWTVDLIDGGGYIPTSMSILNSQDIWVTTESATIFFHYDGYNWDLVVNPFTDLFGDVVVYFDSNITFSHLGINSISMLNPKEGYAVGESGLIIRYHDLLQQAYETLQNVDTNVELLVNRSGKIKAWVQN
jgi:hypothetical protein